MKFIVEIVAEIKTSLVVDARNRDAAVNEACDLLQKMTPLGHTSANVYCGKSIDPKTGQIYTNNGSDGRCFGSNSLKIPDPAQEPNPMTPKQEGEG